MKLFLLCTALLMGIVAQAQADEIKPAAKGVVYGHAPAAEGAAIHVNELQAKLANGAFEGKIKGRVKEVCKAMGCWMTLEKGDGTTVMVETKDHGYFMPQNLAGRMVVVDGTASVKEVSEAQRRHLAEDAGQSQADINKIKGAEKEVQVIANGVEVLE